MSKLDLSKAATIPGDVDLRPLSDFVLLEPIEKGQTAGGIALPAGVDPEPPKAKVLKVGPGRVSEMGTLIPMPVAEGDVVYALAINQNAIGMTLKGRKCVLIRARDLICAEEK